MTSPLEISRGMTISEYVLNFTEPSKSASALGVGVPNPTLPLDVDNAVPTTMLVEVTIPAVICPEVLSKRYVVAVNAPPTLMSVAFKAPSKIATFLTFKSVVPVPVVPTSRLKCGTDVPIPTLVRLFG